MTAFSLQLYKRLYKNPLTSVLHTKRTLIPALCPFPLRQKTEKINVDLEPKTKIKKGNKIFQPIRLPTNLNYNTHSSS